jgi:Mce-associated membrane protein
VTSDARAIPREEDDAMTSSTSVGATASGTGATRSDVPGPDPDRTEAEAVTEEKASGRRARRASGLAGGNDGDAATRTRPSLPLVPVLAVLLTLLLAGVGFLWLTRPGASSVRTADYVGALQAARSGVVDMTSFDHLTLDDDIQQIRRVATGDLRKEAADQLDSRRQQITDTQATVNTEVVGAGVTRASSTGATVVLVIQSTQKSTASPQAQVVRYRIRVELQKTGGRWLLSGIAGTGAGGNG